MIRAALYTYKNDQQILENKIKDMVAYYTNEYLEVLDLSFKEDYKKFLEYQGLVNIICIDVTLNQGIEYAKQARKLHPMSLIIIIAGQNTSPVTYLTPVIAATTLLLKPLQESMVKQAMQSIWGCYIIQEKNEKDLFVIESREYRQRILYSRILFFESKEKKIYVCTPNCKYAFYDTLNHLEQELPKKHFVRCHRSFIVNWRMINNIKLSKNYLELQGEIKVPISRSYKKTIKKLFKTAHAYE